MRHLSHLTGVKFAQNLTTKSEFWRKKWPKMVIGLGLFACFSAKNEGKPSDLLSVS